MSERTYEVRTFGVDYICDKCERGVMNQTGKMFFVDPPLFVHKCSNCGDETGFTEQYPTVRFERLT
jgi:hypothetical protein